VVAGTKVEGRDLASVYSIGGVGSALAGTSGEGAVLASVRLVGVGPDCLFGCGYDM
jgi:hypothetical protein